MLHVPITFRATEEDLQQLELSQGELSPGLGPPAVKTPSARTKDQGGDHDRVPSLLSAGLGCGAVWKWSCVHAASREGFPQALITGVMQSLQLPSAETSVAEIF